MRCAALQIFVEFVQVFLFDFADFFDNLDGELFAHHTGAAEELGFAADVERIGVFDAGVVQAHYVAYAQ